MSPASPRSGAPGDPEAGAGETVLPAGTRFEGVLALPRDARIDGHLRGEVVAHGALWIGPAGVVEADLQAREVRVDGRLRGDLRATERVVLGAGARVDGDLDTPRLAVSEGALLNGRCRAGGADPP